MHLCVFAPENTLLRNVRIVGLVGLVPSALALGACDKGSDTTPPDGDSAIEGDPTADPKSPDPMEDAAEVETDADDSAAQTEAALTISSFEEAIQAHLDDVGDCFAEAKERNAELTGTYQAHFVVGLDGKVTKVSTADHSDIKDDEMNACVLEKSATWQFNKPSHGEPMEMNFPFSFGE